MARGTNALPLSDRYTPEDLEPGVDPDKVSEFLGSPRSPSRPKQESTATGNTPPSTKRAGGSPAAETRPKPKSPNPWTTRTIRLRQNTASALTKASLSQKTKQVEGILTEDEPISVQEIAERGMQLALKELGYLK